MLKYLKLADVLEVKQVKLLEVKVDSDVQTEENRMLMPE